MCHEQIKDLSRLNIEFIKKTNKSAKRMFNIHIYLSNKIECFVIILISNELQLYLDEWINSN